MKNKSDMFSSSSENNASYTQARIVKVLCRSPVRPSLWNIVQGAHREAEVGVEPGVDAGDTSRCVHGLEVCAKAPAVHVNELIDGL